MSRPHKFIVSPGGMGGFLDPPGSPQATYEVVEKAGNGREVGWMSLKAAIDADYVPASTKAEIARLYAKWDKQPTEKWLSEVYGYFKHCYSADGVSRDVSNCITVRLADQQPQREGERYRSGTFGERPYGDELPPIETSLAVMHVREFFPDHEPREDLLTEGQWGRRS